MDTLSIPKNKTACWLAAMRLPFTSVALVPFAVGFIWAASQGFKVSYTMGILGEIAILCICICCHLLGEVCDQEEDKKTIEYGRSKFAGGTLMVVEGQIEPFQAVLVAFICIVIAFICGVIICVYQHSLILFMLGVFGALCAILYSVPPVRLSKRGVGELFIGICYGWLTLSTGFATAVGFLPKDSILICLPIAFSVFNIIFINEFPDFQPDLEAGKRNLMIRIGKRGSSLIYGIANIFIIISLILIVKTIYNGRLIYFLILLPAILFSLILSFNIVFRKQYEQPKQLEKLCGMTIILNHICSITLLVLFLCLSNHI